MAVAAAAVPCTQRLDTIWRTLRSWSLQGPPSNPRQTFGTLAAELESVSASWSDHAADNADLRVHQADRERQLSALQEEVANMRTQNISLQSHIDSKEQELKSAAQKHEASAVDLCSKLVVGAMLRNVQFELGTENLSAQLRAQVSNGQVLIQASRQEVVALQGHNAVLLDDLKQLREEHAALCAQLRESVPPVSVMCRVRPIESYPQHKHDAASLKSVLAVDTNEITMEDIGGRSRKFRVDRVIGGAATQGEVFGATAPWVESVVSGGSTCIFAYGATGSGKTHTLQGAVQGGLAHHAIRRLIEGPGGGEVRISIVEVYLDQIRDLLAMPGNSNGPPVLQCSRRDASGRMIIDCVEEVADQFSKADSVLQRGYAARATEATNCNERSSRSHIVIMVQRPGMVTHGTASIGFGGRLVLVDLAGSENVKRSGADSDCKLLAEAMAINKSLSALADVVEATAKRQTFIPYRNSKLTMLLEDAFNHAKVLLLLHVSPLAGDTTNTAHSFQFAGRVRSVDFGAQILRKDQEERLKASVKRSVDENQKLQANVDQLRKELIDSQQSVQDTKQQMSQISEQLRERQRELTSEKEQCSRLEAAARHQEGQREHKLGVHCPQQASESRPTAARVHSPLPPDYGQTSLQRTASAGSLGFPRRNNCRALGTHTRRDITPFTSSGALLSVCATQATLVLSGQGTNDSSATELTGNVAVALPLPASHDSGTDARGALCDVTNYRSAAGGEMVGKEDEKIKTMMSPSRGPPSPARIIGESPSWCRSMPVPSRSSLGRSRSPQKRLSTSMDQMLVSSEPPSPQRRSLSKNGVIIKSVLKATTVDYAARARRRRERSVGVLSPRELCSQNDEVERRVGFSEETPTPFSPPKWYLPYLDYLQAVGEKKGMEREDLAGNSRQIQHSSGLTPRPSTPRRRRQEDPERWR